MKAISTRQPFAGLIGIKMKLGEVRSVKTSYRGPVLICASQKPYKSPELITDDWSIVKNPHSFGENEDRQRFLRGESEECKIYGHAIAIATLFRCQPLIPSHALYSLICPDVIEQLNAKKQHYLYRFRDVELIEPFPVKGQLGLFNVELPKHGVKYLRD